MIDPVARELETRRQKLLDLTRRNRLLNFRPTRRTTLRVLDEVPSELFRLVQLEGKTLGFLPGEPPPPRARPTAQPPTPPTTEPQPDPVEAPESERLQAPGSGEEVAPVKEVAPAKDAAPGKGVAPSKDASPGKGAAASADVRTMAPTAGAAALGIAFAKPRGRCPFCHDAVSPDDPTAVCNACLSRLHVECWEELGRCASCGGQHALTRTEPAAPAAASPWIASAPEAAVSEPAAPPEPQHDSATFQRTPREKLPERHRDLKLQTTLVPSDLEKNLLAIHRKAASTFEEQGFGSLFLALGFLEWTDRGSKVIQKAPILLVPAELKRRSVRSKFKLSAGDDDALINPALAYKLKQEWGIELPELPDDIEELNPDDVFEALAEKVKDLEGWRVSNESALALFSFTKFVMYKDLEVHQEKLLAHPIVRRLLGGAAEQAKTKGATEPLCVMDADASQRDAIRAVLAGESLVLEGPPGTGKSQTIANLIACFLALGKRVLFVSEKMAALEVVQSRLEDVGLGAFCLELHSRHANKRAVVKNLERTLELPLPPDHAEDEALETLAALDAGLDELVAELHEPWGALEASPYQAIGAIEELSDVADADAEAFLPDLQSSEAWSPSQLEARELALRSLAKHQAQSGSPREHACRGVRLDELTHTGKAALIEALGTLLDDALPALIAEGAALASAVGGEAAGSLTGLAQSLQSAGLLLEPGLPEAEVLANPAWNGEPPRAAELIELRERRATLRGRLEGCFKPELPDKEQLLALVSDVEATYTKWYRFFLPSYHAASSKIAELSVEGYDPQPAVLVRDLTLAAQASSLELKLADAKDDGLALFGRAWPSDKETLERVGDMARRFRRALRLSRLHPQCLERLKAGALDREQVRSAREALASRLESAKLAWERFQATSEFAEEPGLGGAFADLPLEGVRARLAELRENATQLPEWVELRRSVAACEALGLSPVLERSWARRDPPQALPRLLRKAFLMRWFDGALRERRKLATFDRIAQEETLETFRRLDARRLKLARIRLRHKLGSGRPDASWKASEGSELGILHRELRRKRGHMPVRQLLKKIPAAIGDLKPCMLMSPLTVAQFTEPGLHSFDLVLFDEASQIAPEDALGAICRGKQVVVVGDSKQMPPTAFFKAQSDVAELEGAADLESILDECVASGLPRRVLRFHYRSRHESLIAFSNHHFYERSLHTFPSPDDGRGRLGLSRVYVEGAAYERGGSGRNVAETDAVADAVIAHFQRTPERSLGVGTFSQAQQTAILDAVEQRLRRHPELEPLLSRDEEEHFFVKNLENLQGDERDVIFVSIGYGPDADGKLHLNFGPLNQAGGERRLNVLVTRARQQLVVFNSFHADQLDLSKSKSAGLRLLRDYLEYTESRSLPPVPPVPSLAPGLDRFSVVRSLQLALEAQGLSVTTDVGTSAVRVDLGIEEDGRFVLGVLVDGPHYAAFTEARDRERLLPTVLAGLRWRITRVWSMEWHRHPKRVLKALREALDEARTEAAAEPEVEAPEQAIILKASQPEADGDSPLQPYEALEVRKRGESSAFPQAPMKDVMAVVDEVVRAEGPIHFDEVERRALAHWELSRSGKRARKRIDEAVTLAVEQGMVTRRGEFLWPSDLEGTPVRDRSRAGPREIELIAPEEIGAAVTLVAQKEIRIALDDLIKRSAKLLGFSRAGARVQRGVLTVIESQPSGTPLSVEDGIVTWALN